LHKLSLSRRAADEGEEEEEEAAAAAAVEASAAVAGEVATAAVAAEAIVARVEWEEEDEGVDTAGLQCRVVATEVAADQGTCRDPATAQAVWLRTGMSPEGTSTDPKPPPRFNPVRKALGPVFLRLPKEIGLEPEIGLGPARAATKGSRISRIKLAAANSLGKVKELGAASSQAKSRAVRAASSQEKSKAVRAVSSQGKSRAVNWARQREGRWRGAWRGPRSVAVSAILVEVIWAAEAIWAA